MSSFICTFPVLTFIYLYFLCFSFTSSFPGLVSTLSRTAIIFLTISRAHCQDIFLIRIIPSYLYQDLVDKILFKKLLFLNICLSQEPWWHKNVTCCAINNMLTWPGPFIGGRLYSNSNSILSEYFWDK